MHRRLTERDFRRRFVCLTFDDGYRDNLRYALPILQKYDAPFALYIPTSFPDRAGELWWLTLEAVIAQHSRVALVMDGEDRRYDCDTHGSEVRALRAHLLVAAQPRERGRAARARCASSASRYGVDDAAFCNDLCMTWPEIGEIAADPLATIGAHTVNHVMLQEGERRRGAQRDAAERGGDRGGARQAAAAFQLSGRRPHLGGPARVPHRGRARLQDRGDDAAGRAVSRARRAPDRAAAHLAQRRVPAAALRQGADVGRRDRAVERLPPGATRPSQLGVASGRYHPG